MKPITYFAQNEQLDCLTERFGQELDLLDRSQKLQIRVMLSYYILGKDRMGDNYSINDAWMETLEEIMCEDECIIECLNILENITVRQAENLLVALQAQCVQGNAKLKTPVETTTRDLVELGVPVDLARTAAYITHKIDNIRLRTDEEQAVVNQVNAILVRGK